MYNSTLKINNSAVVLNPFIYNRPSIFATSLSIIALLFLHVLCLFIAKSYSAIFVITVTLLASAFVVLTSFFVKKKIDFSCLTIIIQGLLFGLLLPENYPLLTAFLIAFICLLLSQFLFNNYMNSWINIICFAVILAWFVGKEYFPPFLISTDLLSLKNPSVSLIQSGVFPVYPIDVSISEALNNSILSLFNVTLPEGIISLFIDSHSVIPAFRFNLLTIISSAILFSNNSFSKLIPNIFLFVYLLLVRLFTPLFFGGNFNQGDILLALCTSGTLFTSLFLLQWFGTYPSTKVAKIIYAILAGIVAFLIVGCGTSSIGMIYTILICNILNLIIKNFEQKISEKRIFKLINKSNILGKENVRN